MLHYDNVGTMNTNFCNLWIRAYAAAKECRGCFAVSSPPMISNCPVCLHIYMSFLSSRRYLVPPAFLTHLSPCPSFLLFLSPFFQSFFSFICLFIPFFLFFILFLFPLFPLFLPLFPVSSSLFLPRLPPSVARQGGGAWPSCPHPRSTAPGWH